MFGRKKDRIDTAENKAWCHCEEVEARRSNLIHGIASGARRPRNDRAGEGFTLVEILIVSAIFTTVMALAFAGLAGILRSSQRAGGLIEKQKQQRLCLSRMSKQLASLALLALPNSAFSGTEKQFYFVYSKASTLAEVIYRYTPEGGLLEFYTQEPPDYSDATYGQSEACMSGLAGCNFSYSDGKDWFTDWPVAELRAPAMVKVRYQPEAGAKEEEFIANIPVGAES